MRANLNNEALRKTIDYIPNIQHNYSYYKSIVVIEFNPIFIFMLNYNLSDISELK